MINDEADVPYGEDFHDAATALAWQEAANRKRPWRAAIFEHFVSLVGACEKVDVRVLELGSGPGFLAEQVLKHCPGVGLYTLLDFSAPMLAQSRARLERYAARTRFLQTDFKTPSWPTLVGGPFDFAVSLQAVHELRHKRHASQLYSQIPSVLGPAGELLVCDHLPEGAHTPVHRVLYMNPAENVTALNQAGFGQVEVVWTAHDMAFYRARR